MSNKISDLKRNLERHVGGESGEHQPIRVVKPDSKFSRLLRFKSYRALEGFLRAVPLWRNASAECLGSIQGPS
jgi:hypothetical protein